MSNTAKMHGDIQSLILLQNTCFGNGYWPETNFSITQLQK